MGEKIRCKARVSGKGIWGVFHDHRCLNKAVKDGFCNLHHPDTVEKRRHASGERYKEKIKNTPLNIARRKIEELKIENEELKRRLREYEV